MDEKMMRSVSDCPCLGSVLLVRQQDWQMVYINPAPEFAKVVMQNPSNLE